MKFRSLLFPAAIVVIAGAGHAFGQNSPAASPAGLDVATLSEFNKLDRNGDGGLDRMEFAYSEIGQRARLKGSDQIVDRIFHRIDRDGDGKLGLFELAQSQHNRNTRIMDRETAGKFAEFDGDDDGFISREEFVASPSAQQALKSGKDAGYVASIFEGLDVNESGKIGAFEYALLKTAGTDSAEPEREAARKFVKADTNDDGIIDREEFLETPLGRLTSKEGSSTEIDEVFAAIDVNGNGEIGPREFSRARENRDKAGVPKVIIEEYEDLDRNGDGLISLREFARADVAKRAPNRTAMAAMFARANADGNEGLELREFFEMRVRIRMGRANDRQGGKGKGD